MTAIPYVPPFARYITQHPGWSGGAGNPVLAAAVDDALPDLAEHDTGRQRITDELAAATQALLAAARRRADVVGRVVDAATSGKPALDAVLSKAAATAVDVTAATARVELLRDAEQTLGQQRDQLLGQALDVLLPALDHQLQDLLKQARALDLDDVRTAAEAIDAGQVDDWQTSRQLAAQATQIRDAQHHVMVALAHDERWGQWADTFGAVRNYADVFPAWLQQQRRTPTRIVNGDPQYPSPPWDESPDELWEYAAHHTDVELWTPTPRQLHAAVKAATDHARELEAAEQREADGQPLSPDQAEQLRHQRYLQRAYLGNN